MNNYYIKLFSLIFFMYCLKLNIFPCYLCRSYSYLLPDYGHSMANTEGTIYKGNI